MFLQIQSHFHLIPLIVVNGSKKVDYFEKRSIGNQNYNFLSEIWKINKINNK